MMKRTIVLIALLAFGCGACKQPTSDRSKFAACTEVYEPATCARMWCECEIADMDESEYDAISNEPEFQRLREEAAAKMAAQLERVREMERNGELAMLPEAS